MPASSPVHSAHGDPIGGGQPVHLGKLDSFDRKIVQVIQREGDLTSVQLGSRIGLSAASASRRLSRLWESGIIERVVQLVNAQVAGAPTLFIVHLEVDRDGGAQDAALLGWLSGEDAVQQAYFNTGEWNMTLLVCSHEMPQVEELVGRLVRENDGVRRSRTQIVTSAAKRSLFVPVPEGHKYRGRAPNKPRN